MEPLRPQSAAKAGPVGGDGGAVLAPVLNAKDANKELRTARCQILTVGDIGVGKTTLYRTLPGRKFAYLFDPNAKAALAGSDIDYLEFLPERTDLNIMPHRLAKEGGKIIGDKSALSVEPRTFLNFEQDWTARYQSGFFKNYDWLCFDSLTSFSDIIMDRIQFLNGSLGKQPEQADYSGEMVTLRQNLRIAASLCNLYCTAHIEPHRDEVTGKVFSRLVVTGKNRLRIPLLFSDIFGCDVETLADGKVQYQVRTVKSKDIPIARTSRRGLPPVANVTLDPKKPEVGQAIGAWF